MKNRRSPKDDEQKIKTWMGNSSGNAVKKSTSASKKDKTGKMLKHIGTRIKSKNK